MEFDERQIESRAVRQGVTHCKETFAHEPASPEEEPGSNPIRWGDLQAPLPHRWDPIGTPAILLVETKLAHPDLPVTPAIDSPESAALILQITIGNADRENFVALLLNTQNELTHVHLVSQGSLNATIVHPREVFKAAILANAASIIVGHNHPSGKLAPSSEDIATFERLQRAGELLGIPVLDSLIVASHSEFYSLSKGA